MLTGSGLIRVIRSVVTCHVDSLSNNGYLVWFPSYHNRGFQVGGAVPATNTAASMFHYEAPATFNSPTTTAPISTPLWSGTGPSGTTIGCTEVDPAYNILGSTFRDAATLAACMKFRYLGQTATNSGAVGSIQGIDLAACLNTDGSNTFGPVINNLITYAEQRDRPQMDAHEVKWSPTFGSGAVFRGPGDIGANNSVSNQTDSLTIIGVPTFSVTRYAENSPNSATGIGFVWSGLQKALTSGSDIEIELIKVVQLRLSPVSGLREAETIVPSVEVFSAATQYLDNLNPAWRTTAGHLADVAMNAAMRGLSNAALAGITGMASMSGRNRLRNL